MSNESNPAPVAGTAAVPAAPELTPEQQLIAQRDGGTSWLFWVAALSLINTGAAIMGSDWRFVIGLGATQIVDVLVGEMGTVARVVGGAISLAIAGLFAGFGLWGRTRPWLLWVAMILFAVDALVFVLVQDWIGVAFHALVIYMVFQGWRAAVALQAKA